MGLVWNPVHIRVGIVWTERRTAEMLTHGYGVRAGA
jgi:hypothetical protein